ARDTQTVQCDLVAAKDSYPDCRADLTQIVALYLGVGQSRRGVFGDPEAFRLDRDPGLNLLYGAGIHVCPGAPLARLELRLIIDHLLAATQEIAPIAGKPPVRDVYPGSGFRQLPLRVVRRAAR
ncbi:hypothetical protein SAMN05444340_1411, partial [Citreimonas salinaria]